MMRTGLVKALERVGVVVENPVFYSGLTGRENLMNVARMYGNVPQGRIEDIVEMVGLKDRIDDKVKVFPWNETTVSNRTGVALRSVVTYPG